MDMEQVKELLRVEDACDPAYDWFCKQENPEQAWYDCKRFDWLLWLLNKLDFYTSDMRSDFRQFVSGDCSCISCLHDQSTDEQGVIMCEMIRAQYTYENALVRVLEKQQK